MVAADKGSVDIPAAVVVGNSPAADNYPVAVVDSSPGGCNNCRIRPCLRFRAERQALSTMNFDDGDDD